jgi:hypothetical protein
MALAIPLSVTDSSRPETDGPVPADSGNPIPTLNEPVEAGSTTRSTIDPLPARALNKPVQAACTLRTTDEDHGCNGYRGHWRQRIANLFYTHPTTDIASTIPALSSISSSPLSTVKDTPLPGGWDEGVFDSELLKSSIVPRNITAAHTGQLITPPKAAGKPTPVQEGTYHGTKMALTQMMARIERR